MRAHSRGARGVRARPLAAEKATRLGDLEVLAPILADGSSPELQAFVADLLAFIDHTNAPFGEDLKNVDKRTRYAKRFTALMYDLTKTYGEWKDLSQDQRTIIRRIAALTIEAEKMDANQLRGKEIDAGQYAIITGHLNRCYEKLGEEVAEKKQRKSASERLVEWLTTLKDESKDLVAVFLQSKEPDPKPVPKTAPITMDRLTHPRRYGLAPATYEPEPLLTYEPAPLQEPEPDEFSPNEKLAEAIARVF